MNEPSKIPAKIRKLDEVVINRIAAGEVVQRPANALKELLENCLDAGATNIQVVVKSGGLKLLQIQDDGTGIRKEDLTIVCERFTTSKLEKFEDLQNIGTYGFRGEALASISHVAHLTIITKTIDSQCAYRAEYTDGRLKVNSDGSPNPKPCAGKQGTVIIVEDLFYNMDTRRRALKNPSDEHNKIVDVITRYAVHNANVGFSLKKHGETLTEIRTPSNSSAVDNIKVLYGSQIARELVPVSCDDKGTQFKMNGYVSNVNYSMKKSTFLLFINHRLVDSTALRKSVDSVYSNYLPKGSHPFLYLSIEIDPRNVDVNVHPTKHEVHFLHEDMIISTITNAIENILLGSNQSRTFLVQSLLPGTCTTNTNVKKRKEADNENPSSSSKPSKSYKAADVLPKNMVRTDPKDQKLDRFLSSTPNPDVSVQNFTATPSRISYGNSSMSSFVVPTPMNVDSSSCSKDAVPNANNATKSSEDGELVRREIKLRSVKNLQKKIETDCHNGMLDVVRNHVFVGCVDRSLALFQHETKLYICNIFKLSCELFYQKLMYDFGNFGRIIIDDPMTVKELALVALEMEAEEGIDEKLKDPVYRESMATTVEDILVSKSAMLDDYFSLTFDKDGRLLRIPLLLDNYFPSMEGIPCYLVNLARSVNWTDEQKCFETFSHQTALFYAVQPGNSAANEEISLNGKSWKWTIEHVVFPEIKHSLLPPKPFAEDSTVVTLTSLPELYKVFERC